MRQEGMNDRELEKNEHGKYVDLTMRWAYAAWQARAALSAPAPITAEQLVRVSAQGVHFGNAWFSHERITGYTAEQLNAGHCKVTGGAYMEWVRAALSAPVAAQPAASGVEALWVEEAMELALDCEGLHGPRYGKARDALRTHLSTDLTGAAKDTK